MLFLDNAFEWINTHPDLMSMIMLSYLIIPNYFIFRFAPRNTHHTLPQGFFIQVFSSVAFLILNMLYDITSMSWFVFVLGSMLLYFTYKQLFGYGIWGTIWRVLAAFLCALLLASFFLWMDYCIHLFLAGNLGTAKRVIFFELGTVIVFIAILWISYKISKPRKPKPSEPSGPSESEPAPAEQKIDAEVPDNQASKA